MPYSDINLSCRISDTSDRSARPRTWFTARYLSLDAPMAADRSAPVPPLRSSHHNFSRRPRNPRGTLTFQRVSRSTSRSRSEEHTSELQSLMRISYAVFCLKKKKTTNYSKSAQTTHDATK